MTIHIKNFALATLATAALVACGGGSENNAQAPETKVAKLTSSFAIGDTWNITLRDADKTEGTFTAQILVGAYDVFKTGQSVEGKWSHSGENLTLSVANHVIKFKSEKPQPSENTKVINIQSFSKTAPGGISEDLIVNSTNDPISTADADISTLFANAPYQYVGLRFSRADGSFQGGVQGVATKGVQKITLDNNDYRFTKHSSNGFFNAFSQGDSSTQPIYTNRGLIYQGPALVKEQKNINFDYIDANSTGMTYLIDTSKYQALIDAKTLDGNWTCTSYIDKKITSNLKINSTSLEIKDFYNGQNKGTATTSSFAINNNAIQLKNNTEESTNTFIYPIDQNFFIVSDQIDGEPQADFLGCKRDNETNTDNESSTVQGGSFKPTQVTVEERSATVDPAGGITKSTAQDFLYFKTNRTTQLVSGWKYDGKTLNEFGYDIGEYIYVNDMGSFSNPSNDRALGAYSFLNGKLLIGCEGRSWQETFVVALNEAKEVKDLSSLNNKTFIQYSCEPGETDGYAEASVVNNVFDDHAPISELFGTGYKNIYGQTYYYKAFEINNKIFAVGQTNNENGINLMIQK